MNKTLLPSVILFAVTLGACGPTLRPPSVSPDLLRQEAALQREYVYKLTVERRIKLSRIYTPLRIANADLCGQNLSPVTGITGIDGQNLDLELRAVAQRVHGLSDGIKILDIVPRSPAAQAGLLPGDVITGAAKGAGVMPSGWSWSGLTILDLVKVIEASNSEPITLLIRRGPTTFPLALTPRFGCRYPIELKFDDSLNAHADGMKIVVHTGTFNHVPDDQQLAFLIGHELAHNILEHVQKMQGNAAVGAIAGAVLDIGLAVAGINTGGAGARAGAEAGAKVYSKEFESEADYLGLYLLARSGFDITAAQELFRRMGAEKPSAQLQLYSSTHPSTPERSVAMQQTVAEISNKTANQISLLPATLPGQVLAVRSMDQIPPAIVVAAAPPLLQAPPAKPAAMVIQPATSFTAAQPSQPVIIEAAPPTRASIGTRALAQLFLIKGPIVTNPPQTFSAEFLETGKAQVILSGRKLLTGDFELFALGESIKAKYGAKLVNPDGVKPSAGADAKGFAMLSDSSGTQIECAYSFSRLTGRGEGTCVDNQRNTYRLVFD